MRSADHTTLRGSSLEDELIDQLDAGLIADRSDKPYSPVVSVVGTQRAEDEVLGLVEDFMFELSKRYPKARLVVGDVSSIEKFAAELAEMMGMPFEVIKKGKKGEWDGDSIIRDERCVARATHVVVFDESARSKTYKTLAERQRKKFSSLAGKSKQSKQSLDRATNHLKESHGDRADRRAA
jgi:hypothetical protein